MRIWNNKNYNFQLFIFGREEKFETEQKKLNVKRVHSQRRNLSVISEYNKLTAYKIAVNKRELQINTTKERKKNIIKIKLTNTRVSYSFCCLYLRCSYRWLFVWIRVDWLLLFFFFFGTFDVIRSKVCNVSIFRWLVCYWYENRPPVTSWLPIEIKIE